MSPVVAVVIAVWGFRRANKADKLRAFFEIQSRYLATEVRAGRRALHQKVAGRPPEEISDLDKSDLDSVGYALAVMNSVAIACAGGYVEYDLVKNSMGRSFVTAMAAARPYIDRVEGIRGYRPYPAAERLAERLTLTVGVSLASSPGATQSRAHTAEPGEDRGITNT
ncbi:DUF4760 domain-containing protein [Streptomyces sp. W16]|uniref:DUF4760 domain-containing protein n=1 Tax=Streptomyces sp. W16 TaxID=3076631 RepID=UPI003FA3845C